MKNNRPHIIHVFPSFGRGGVPIKICHAINHFGRRARHTIISTNCDYGSEDLIEDGLDVAVDKSHHDVRGSLLSRLKRYRHYLKKSGADLLITYNWGSVEWALANSFGPLMRHIHVESGFGPDEANGTIARRDLFRRFAIRNIDALSVPSNTLIEIAKDKWKVPERKIKYIPNGVDLEKFTPDGDNCKITGFEKGKDEIIVGTIAPLRPEKNISRLITSFSHVLKNVPELKTRLLIMGEGVEKKKLEALADQLKNSDKVFFSGHISEPAKAIGILDIFAISSDTEQMPNAVNEAMAVGLPIAGVDVGDVKHMVSEENKPFIAPVGDDDAFANVIKELIGNKSLRDHIGRENLHHVRKYYNRRDMYKKYADLWGIN